MLRTDVLNAGGFEARHELTGTVRNVIDFGAFVDIGVHPVAWCISPGWRTNSSVIRQLVHVGDVVTVWVVDVDVKKQRIALSMVKEN